MKFIIFADKAYNYRRPIADGLYKSIIECGHEAEIWYDGIYWLYAENLFFILLKDIWRFFANFSAGKKDLYIYRFFNTLTFYNKKRKQSLYECDAIIIVDNCPNVFIQCSSNRLEMIRGKYRKPIVNYDFHYLPNQGWWKYIKKEKKYYGLERFDWYLPIGLTTEFIIPPKIPVIYNCIGMDIKNKELYPDQKEFSALIDFPHSTGAESYSLVIEALEELGINYIQLKGRYTTSEIRSLYRRCSIYFVNVRESFGLPIIEEQLCGCYIFTPYIEWCPAHFLECEKNHTKSLGSNFICYHNNKEELKEKILKVKSLYNSKQVIRNFQDEYPNYYSIDKKELELFFKNIQNGCITHSSHEEYEQYNQYLSLTDDYDKANYQSR